MKKMVCELCGSNEFSKDGELFACDHCRTKYTPDQAKSMLIEGTVQVDRSNEVANFLRLAKTALDNGNPQGAYDYANRALEIDSAQSDAWQYKGVAAGWLSNLAAFRGTEMVNSFRSAWDCAPESERDGVRGRSAVVMHQVAVVTYGRSLDYVREYGRVAGIWDRHVALCTEVIWTLQLSYEWGGSRQPLDDIVTISSELLGGVRYGWGATLQWQNLNEDGKKHFRALISQAAEQIRKQDPTYVEPKLEKGRRWNIG